MLEDAFENAKAIKGILNGRVKGGFTVDINDIRAFLPGSLVDIRPLRETTHTRGQDPRIQGHQARSAAQQRGRVASRRARRRKQRRTRRTAGLAAGRAAQERHRQESHRLWRVRGLGRASTGCCISRIWPGGRIRHPSEMVNVGDEVEIKILRFDREKNRVSLGMKQLGDDPWVNLSRRYPTSHTRAGGRDQPHGLRLLRRDRRGRGRPGARLRDGLDQQEHSPVPGRGGRRSDRGS